MADQAMIGPGSLTLVSRSLRPRLVAVVRRGNRLEHFERRTDRPDRPWLAVSTVTEHAVGPGAVSNSSGRLQVEVPEPEGRRHYRWDGLAWRRWDGESAMRISVSTLSADGLGMAATTAIVGGRRRAHALVELDGSLYGYHWLPQGRWVRSSCLLVDEGDTIAAVESSVKRAQVTGERDATPTPWGERLPTLSRSLSTAGVRGTDLGVRFDHAGRSFLFFGDTHWTRGWLALRDAIAEVLAVEDGELPRIELHGSPLRLRGRGVTMGEYDVPLDAVSLDGHLFGFFTSNHGRGGQVMGRSVLARCADPELPINPARRRRPIRFDVLTSLSDRHFVNVSAQLRPAASVPGCGNAGNVVLLWGTGAYRASEIRLALLDQAGIDRLLGLRREAPVAALGLRYWDGSAWADREEAAAPLFRPGAYGELSVRWISQVGRYALLTATGPRDPAGSAITLRWADHPWGPWTPRLRLFDWVADGMCADPFTRFIKARRDDPVAEDLFRAQSGGNGAAYAPYLFDVQPDGEDLVLRYTLSTWNPYQVVLMQHRLTMAECHLAAVSAP
mgnify:CR=1 FL=1